MFRDIFGIRKFDRLSADPTQNFVESGDGTGVAPLTKLDPEHYQAVMRIPATHIHDELQLGVGVCIGMAVRAVRAVCQGMNVAVVLLAPTIDILSGSLVLLGGRSNNYTLFYIF